LSFQRLRASRPISRRSYGFGRARRQARKTAPIYGAMKGRAPPKEAPPLFIAAGQDDSAVNVGDDEMKTLLPMMSYAVVPNITYRKVNGWGGKLDVMTPRGSKGSNPTLIYYHGGGWRTGSKEERMPLLLPYMAMEWTIVNVEYRLSDLALAPAAVEDALCDGCTRTPIKHGRLLPVLSH
jgi:hypothetical protein